MIICWTVSGRWSNRSALATAGRLRPTRTATWCCVSPNSSIKRWKAEASSSGLRSSRWTFSTMACSRLSRSPTSRTSAGMADNPARRAARQRRSPATSSRPSSVRRTRTGWRTPISWMDNVSSAIFSSSKTLRGW